MKAPNSNTEIGAVFGGLVFVIPLGFGVWDLGF
jgi:hypothetical protein